MRKRLRAEQEAERERALAVVLRALGCTVNAQPPGPATPDLRVTLPNRGHTYDLDLKRKQTAEGPQTDLRATQQNGIPLQQEDRARLLALLEAALGLVHRGARTARPTDPTQSRDLHALLHQRIARYRLALALTAYRDQHGVSVRRLAAEAQLSYSYVGRLERAEASLPSLESVQLLLETLGIPSCPPSPGDKTSGPQPPPAPQGLPTDPQRSRALRALWRHVDRLPADAVIALASVAKSMRRLAARSPTAP